MLNPLPEDRSRCVQLIALLPASAARLGARRLVGEAEPLGERLLTDQSFPFSTWLLSVLRCRPAMFAPSTGSSFILGRMLRIAAPVSFWVSSECCVK